MLSQSEIATKLSECRDKLSEHYTFGIHYTDADLSIINNLPGRKEIYTTDELSELAGITVRLSLLKDTLSGLQNRIDELSEEINETNFFEYDSVVNGIVTETEHLAEAIKQLCKEFNPLVRKLPDEILGNLE